MSDFLKALFPYSTDDATGDDLYLELRLIREGKVEQRFVPIYSTQVPDLAVEDSAGWDCYFGVLPRRWREGTAEACVSETHVLWIDCDAKRYDGDKVRALIHLLQANLSPSILVDSGNGWHGYWLLREPVPFSQAAEAMKGLANQLGGDHVYDAPRVLRLPGTHNHKADLPKPVRLLVCDPERRYRFSDFEDYFASRSSVYQKPPIYHGGEVRPNGKDHQAYADLPIGIRELIEKGASVGRRSEAIFHVYCDLIERGWAEEQIAELMLRDHPLGIGEKVSEMSEKQADRWMRRTYERAMEVVG